MNSKPHDLTSGIDPPAGQSYLWLIAFAQRTQLSRVARTAHLARLQISLSYFTLLAGLRYQNGVVSGSLCRLHR